jgi:hypothetical protein
MILWVMKIDEEINEMLTNGLRLRVKRGTSNAVNSNSGKRTLLQSSCGQVVSVHMHCVCE